MSHGIDQELAVQAAAGDAAAFARLIERQYDRIHRLAWRLTGTETDAEDVAQEVCIKLGHAIRTFRGEAEVSTWIWRITYNAATDVLRQRQRIKPFEPSEMMRLVDGAAMAQPESHQMSQDEPHAVWARVQELAPKQRNAVLLVYGEEMTHRQAATVMGCSEKTVSWHLHEARKRLKSMLEAVG